MSTAAIGFYYSLHWPLSQFRMFVLPDGRTLALDTPFVWDEIQYPGNWLRLASPAEREAIGITEVADPPVYDQRYYWGYDSDGNLIPKQFEDEPQVDEEGEIVVDENGRPIIITGLKTQQIRQQKEIAGTLLASTDWYITRQAETGTPAPDNVLAYRQAVRTVSGSREAAISACATVEEMIALQYSQPTIYDFETEEQIPNPDPFLEPWPTES